MIGERITRVMVLAAMAGLVLGARSDTTRIADAGAPSFTPSVPVYRVPEGHPRIVLSDEATRARLSGALRGRTYSAMRFQTEVAQQLQGRRSYQFQPWFAALMFQLTDDPRYARYAIEETDKLVAAEEERIARGERAEVSNDSYLDVGSIIGNLSIVYDWCHGQLTDQQRARWIRYGNQAVWNVWNPARAQWGTSRHPWTGWSVDNPSNNYHYSFLRATMLLGLATHGENPEAARWLEQFRSAKVESQLMPVFARDLPGGGSREGTGYGTAMKNLFQLYDWWQKSTGEDIASRTPHARESLAYMLHSIVPTRDRIVPVGDHSRDSSAALFDYHREYLLTLAALFPDDPLSGAAAALLDRSTVPRMRNGFMFVVDFLYDALQLPRKPLADLATTYWAAGTGHLMMRSSWDTGATYAHFICGPYTESHAHRDQGSFLLYKGGWLAVDGNVHSSSGIEQDEEFHNLVRFETSGKTVRQQPGTACTMAARADSAVYTYAAARVTPVYKGQAGVRQSEREFLYLKPDTFVVLDRAVAVQGTSRRVWTLNLGGEPRIEGDALLYSSGDQRMEVLRLSPAGLASRAVSWPSLRKSLARGVRVDVADESSASEPFLHVLSVNGSVRVATRSDRDGYIGAQVQLADGRTAVVRFALKSIGGELEVKAADGSLLVSGPLGAERPADPPRRLP